MGGIVLASIVLCLHQSTLVRAAALRPAERRCLMNQRNNRVQIWMNDEELNRLNAKVKKCGLSRESYIRLLIENVTPKETPQIEFSEILKHLRQINNNLNQIAMRANASGFIDARAYRENYSRLQEQIGEIIRGIY